MLIKTFSSAFALSLGLACFVEAQPIPDKPDSNDVKALIDKAKKIGGTQWADAEHFFCEAPHANSANDLVIPATKIFDNVYAVGNAGTTAYIFQTSDGLMMLDSLGAAQTDTQLLPAFQKLGLDPAKVKIMVMGHGHADHFGGSPYFQDHYGTKVYISAADWNMMENPPAGRGGEKKKGPPVVLPKHDQVVTEGEPIVLGDFKVVPVAIPGHTPGSMGYIFAVKDNGKTRMAATYGGTILTPAAISDENLQIYLKSIAHFQEETKKAKVEIVLQNHPLMYPEINMIDALLSRKKGQPNPFVVGQANQQKFFDVMSTCIEVAVARRKL